MTTLVRLKIVDHKEPISKVYLHEWFKRLTTDHLPLLLMTSAFQMWGGREEIERNESNPIFNVGS
jgi:hypothetical protein